jgi:hypothetical protein
VDFRAPRCTIGLLGRAPLRGPSGRSRRVLRHSQSVSPSRTVDSSWGHAGLRRRVRGRRSFAGDRVQGDCRAISLRTPSVRLRRRRGVLARLLLHDARREAGVGRAAGREGSGLCDCRGGSPIDRQYRGGRGRRSQSGVLRCQGVMLRPRSTSPPLGVAARRRGRANARRRARMDSVSLCCTRR